MEEGYLLIVLNTHLPFVRDPGSDPHLEEHWLFDAITESYIPLIEVLEGLVADGADFKITLSLSPTLTAMLDMVRDDLLRRRYLSYLDSRIRLAESEAGRLAGDPRRAALARLYGKRFESSRASFLYRWPLNLLLAFRQLKRSGKVELITSSATHAFLPLWELYPRVVGLQTSLGVRQHELYFGERPSGFWLPECGYTASLEGHLSRAGVRYFFLDAHGVLNGHPRPKFGEYAPVHSPAGAAVFGRDWMTHDLVWLKDKGYPGDPLYRSYEGDIGFELDLDYLSPLTRSRERVPTGIKYSSNGQGAGGVYDPDAALRRCDEHANHFVSACQGLVGDLRHRLGRKPLIVALFDTEHFGHWWHEGPAWLNLVLRKLAFDQGTVKLVTAGDYLRLHPTNQVVAPSTSSWGYQGYSETWLMGRNHWVYPAVFEMIEALDELLRARTFTEGLHLDAINQYLRELLLAQSSDWAFMMHAQAAQRYAENRVNEHLGNMKAIYRQLLADNIDPDWLRAVQDKNNIFRDANLVSLYHNQGPV